MDTETLDKLYLEWSQFTSARNRREEFALRILREVKFTAKRPLGKLLKAQVAEAIDKLNT